MGVKLHRGFESRPLRLRTACKSATSGTGWAARNVRRRLARSPRWKRFGSRRSKIAWSSTPARRFIGRAVAVGERGWRTCDRRRHGGGRDRAGGSCVVTCERLKNSSGAAMGGLLEFGDGVIVTITVLTPATDGEGTARAANERWRRHERSEERRVRVSPPSPSRRVSKWARVRPRTEARTGFVLAPLKAQHPRERQAVPSLTVSLSAVEVCPPNPYAHDVDPAARLGSRAPVDGVTLCDSGPSVGRGRCAV